MLLIWTPSILSPLVVLSTLINPSAMSPPAYADSFTQCRNAFVALRCSRATLQQGLEDGRGENVLDIDLVGCVMPFELDQFMLSPSLTKLLVIHLQGTFMCPTVKNIQLAVRFHQKSTHCRGLGISSTCPPCHVCSALGMARGLVWMRSRVKNLAGWHAQTEVKGG